MNAMKIMQKGQSLLTDHSIPESQLEAGLLMGHVLGCEREELYLNRDIFISPKQEQQYLELIQKRCQNIPLQYLIGHRQFMGLNFYVDERVLIPRNDTEILVEFVMESMGNIIDSEVRIVDVGTGSGAIAISLAKFIPKAIVTALDIDEGALNVAKSNALYHGVEDRMSFFQGDLLAPLASRRKDIKFHVMVSNPPYIPSSEIENLEAQVRDYEPRKALDGGQDGLDFYWRLARDARWFLLEGGLWVVEVGYNQAEDVVQILNKIGHYRDIQIIRDLSGYNRVVAAIVEPVNREE